MDQLGLEVDSMNDRGLEHLLCLTCTHVVRERGLENLLHQLGFAKFYIKASLFVMVLIL